MFIGRERELTALQNQYNSSKFEFTVIYGRRRVGKTAIINEFVKDKDVIYFTGVESNEKQNLENFSQSIMSYKSDLPQGSEFTSFQDALEFVFKLAQEKRIVLVIDEYPYVAKASKSLASTLQLMIDKHKDASKLFLFSAVRRCPIWKTTCLHTRLRFTAEEPHSLKSSLLNLWKRASIFQNSQQRIRLLLMEL